MPVRFVCTQCQKLLRVGRKKIGQAVTCPKCESQVVVPQRDAVSGALVPLKSSKKQDPSPETISAEENTSSSPDLQVQDTSEFHLYGQDNLESIRFESPRDSQSADEATGEADTKEAIEASEDTSESESLSGEVVFAPSPQPEEDHSEETLFEEFIVYDEDEEDEEVSEEEDWRRLPLVESRHKVPANPVRPGDRYSTQAETPASAPAATLPPVAPKEGFFPNSQPGPEPAAPVEAKAAQTEPDKQPERATSQAVETLSGPPSGTLLPSPKHPPTQPAGPPLATPIATGTSPLIIPDSPSYRSRSSVRKKSKPAPQSKNGLITWFYLQYFIFAGMMVALFAWGWYAGKQEAQELSSGLERVVESTVLEGRVVYESQPGRVEGDSGSLVLILPEFQWPAPKLDPQEVWPQGGIGETPEEVKRRIERLGGSLIEADLDGNYLLNLPRVGTYQVLYISRHTRRTDVEAISDQDRITLDNYFANPGELLGSRRYHLQSVELSNPLKTLAPHAFGPSF
ncbi:Hypothetical protein PBC10988_12830 [Planctomycetales bacterium 10988]|nr:Hypothetical protein PBC10988_12830 [Planctomycetales bacterium 10988]